MSLFITFEGIEGSGKSTQSRLLSELFNKNNQPSIVTREPGGTIGAEKIRELLLDKDLSWSNLSEMFLHMSARAEHLYRVIKPNIIDGNHVVCDRFIDSTIAYQGHAQGIEINKIIQLHQLAFENYYPDLTIVLDLAIEDSFKRMNKRNKIVDRYEAMDIDFHQKIKSGFTSIARLFPNRCVVLDASHSITNLQKQITDLINDRFNLNLKD